MVFAGSIVSPLSHRHGSTVRAKAPRAEHTWTKSIMTTTMIKQRRRVVAYAVCSGAATAIIKTAHVHAWMATRHDM